MGDQGSDPEIVLWGKKKKRGIESEWGEHAGLGTGLLRVKGRNSPQEGTQSTRRAGRGGEGSAGAIAPMQKMGSVSQGGVAFGDDLSNEE